MPRRASIDLASISLASLVCLLLNFILISARLWASVSCDCVSNRVWMQSQSKKHENWLELSVGNHDDWLKTMCGCVWLCGTKKTMIKYDVVVRLSLRSSLSISEFQSQFTHIIVSNSIETNNTMNCELQLCSKTIWPVANAVTANDLYIKPPRDEIERMGMWTTNWNNQIKINCLRSEAVAQVLHLNQSVGVSRFFRGICCCNIFRYEWPRA